MIEGPTDKPPLRVIEGGKKELKQLPNKPEVADPRKANIERVRKLSPSLDLYLSQPPADKFERMSLVDDIGKELWKLPGVGGPDSRNAAWKRTEERLGKYPPSPPGHFTWRDRTDAQIVWDEQYTLEHANTVGEKMGLMSEQQRKINTLEDELNQAAGRHYGNEDSDKSKDPS